MKGQNVKARYWAAVVYPESLPENWLEQLQQTGLCVAISPLHDMDLDPTGEKKKAHYHLILAYSGPTTFSNVASLMASLGQPIPQKLEQVRGYYRYLTHKDNPEKAQYSENDIRTLNGFNIADFVELSRHEVEEEKRRLMAFIRDAWIYEYADFLDALIDNGDFQGLEIASNHTFLFDRYISSRRHRDKSEGMK